MTSSDPLLLAVPAAPVASACVYHDGGCPLCRAEIAAYQQAAGSARLRWVDAQACTESELGAGLPRTAALARLHVRRADGTLMHGAPAFVEIWSALPRRAWLARVARLPGLLPLLDRAYGLFMRLRPTWRRAPPVQGWLPRPLLRELRSDHAGETGAVMIYRGVLAVARDPALRAFATHHLATESRHLALIEDVMPVASRSRLLPLWRAAGWMTGALPACFSPRAVYATIEAVETFVDRHYAAQLPMIDEALLATDIEPGNPEARAHLQSLRVLLEQCRLDEVAHRDDAAARWDGRAPAALALWRELVGRGSAVAVAVCRHV